MRTGVATIAGLLLLAGCGEVDTSRDAQYEAEDACRHFVEQRLKAPSTAEYSDETAVQGVGDQWTCTGTVDSENSFGGTVRNTYQVTVEKREDGLWYEVSLNGLTN